MVPIRFTFAPTIASGHSRKGPHTLRRRYDWKIATSRDYLASSSGAPAIAVGTLMFSANATDHLNLLAHGMAGAMNTNGSVSFCNAGAISEIAEATARKVNCG
jgi:hypothetical protein